MHVCLLYADFLFLQSWFLLYELTGVAAVVSLCACPSRLYEQQGSSYNAVSLTGQTSAAARYEHADIYYWAAGFHYSYQWVSVHSADKLLWVCLFIRHSPHWCWHTDVHEYLLERLQWNKACLLNECLEQSSLSVTNYNVGCVQILSIRFIIDHGLNVKDNGQKAIVESQWFLLYTQKIFEWKP